MIRVALINLLFFVLPFIGYALYLYLRKGRFDARQDIDQRTFISLIVGGAACVIIGFAVLGTFQSGDPKAVYEPARYEDGVLKPGGFRSQKSEAD